MAGWLHIGNTVSMVVVIALLNVLPLRLAAAQSSSAQPTSVTPGDAEPINELIDEAAQRFDIPAAWVRFVIQVESAGDARAVSPKGAIGLMQLMPETYARLRQSYALGTDPFLPRDNILAGTAYLRELLDRYGSSGFLAAYNAGPKRYDDNLAMGRPLPRETIAYLARLDPLITGMQSADGPMASDPVAWMRAPLFVARGGKTNLSSQNNAGEEHPSRPNPQSSEVPDLPATPDASSLRPHADSLFVEVSIEAALK